MNQHTRFNLPLCLKVEQDAFAKASETVGRYLPEIVGQKSMIISEQFLIETFSEELSEIQRTFGSTEVYAVEHADFDEAVKIAKMISIKDFKIIIGFGGGRVLDTAKYAAHISKAVYICLPTSLSNDSLASPFSVLGVQGRERKTLPCKIPTAIIVDTDMIKNAPKTQTLSGIGDTIAKHTALFDWKLSAKQTGTNMDDFAYAISRMSFDSVYHCDDKDLSSPTFIRILSRALVMGGLAMEIAGCSRPCSGSEHLFCHALEEYYPEIRIPHGIGVALGSVAACVFQGRDETQLLNVLNMYGLDLNPETYGITKEIWEDAWRRARGVRPGRVTILDSTELDSKWLEEIYDRMKAEAERNDGVK